MGYFLADLLSEGVVRDRSLNLVRPHPRYAGGI